MVSKMTWATYSFKNNIGCHLFHLAITLSLFKRTPPLFSTLYNPPTNFILHFCGGVLSFPAVLEFPPYKQVNDNLQLLHERKNKIKNMTYECQHYLPWRYIAYHTQVKEKVTLPAGCLGADIVCCSQKQKGYYRFGFIEREEEKSDSHQLDGNREDDGRLR